MANRLYKGDTQTLRAGGRTFGLPGDGFRDPRRRFAALHKYNSGYDGQITGDLKKPFFFTDVDGDLGIFRFFGRKLRWIRTLANKTSITKARPNFEKAVDKYPPQRIRVNFIKKAKQFIAGLRD